MRWKFRRHGHDEAENGGRRRMPVFSIILMAIGLLTLLYLATVYILMPLLALLTVS